MHKLAKGLKKKKKGKKSKRKEEELFKPEELEAYRKEHQSTNEAGESGTKNEEWKKFLSLTSEVDDILKKTQTDLDRIKSTSFFQRVPPPSEVKKKEEEQQQSVAQAEPEEKQDPAHFGIVEVSESESEEDEEDDIFDTTYIDAIAAGEVKLAYIPESPTDTQEGDDPFDTSIAERAILGPAVERKGKKLVPLGAAVEVLTGRVQLPTCATKPVSNRRQILKQRDLLLGSFDDNANSVSETHTDPVASPPKTLLDDDEIPLPDEPIDLSRTLYIPPIQTVPGPKVDPIKNIVNEFEDDDDKEFEELAIESISKPIPNTKLDLSTRQPELPSSTATGWNAFGEKNNSESSPVVEDLEKDPFDTTFAENILPGKAELKLIENEILKNDIDFNPRSEEKSKTPKFNIHLLDSDDKTFTGRVPETKLNLIKPIHRDLLGGSNTDLSKLADNPLQPSEKSNENYIEYCDPFDTSIVEIAKKPGQAELKFLEKELLSDIQIKTQSEPDDDFDFDPRAGEIKPKERTLSRPDVLNVSKSVSFAIPSPANDLLGAVEGSAKVSKPLTPFYVRKNSVPEEPVLSDLEDPFDTSFVGEVAPGKAELKVIEKELFDPVNEKNLNITDQDFDPRDEKKIERVTVVETIKQIGKRQTVELSREEPKPIDLLAVDNNIATKVLTPAAEESKFEELSYRDPFDTSIATNILPGKTELKLLESELISDLTYSDFNPRLEESQKDLLVHRGDTIITKPLSPISGVNFEIPGNSEDENFDPFDTSIANNIQPGKAELKLLESELI